MKGHLIGGAIAFLIIGFVELRRYGWLPLHKPETGGIWSQLGWLIDRIYLLYWLTALVLIVAASIVGR